MSSTVKVLKMQKLRSVSPLGYEVSDSDLNRHSLDKCDNTHRNLKTTTPRSQDLRERLMNYQLELAIQTNFYFENKCRRQYDGIETTLTSQSRTTSSGR